MCFAGWKESQRFELKMKLLIFVAAFSFANGKMIEFTVTKEEIIPVTKMPKWGSELFNRVIGGCALSQFTFSTQPCQVAFYLSFRTNKTQSCSIRFNIFSKCYLIRVKFCLRKVLSGRALDDAIHQHSVLIWKYKKFQCGEADYKPSKWFPEFPLNDECPKKMPRKLDKCVNKWYKVFQKAPGSHRLCRKYHYGMRCLKKVLRKCKFDLSKSFWIFSKHLNPFCDEQQRRRLPGKWRSRFSGK